MKIAIYTHNLSDLGGIERVVREHLRIFAAHGVECKVFGDEGGRALLTEWHPDYCILHGVAHPKVADDIAVCHELNIPVIAVCHFSFPSAMLLDGDESANRNFLKYATLCDMVTPVSEIDTLWWRALGCRAMHVQNPFVHPRPLEKGGASTLNLDIKPQPVELLWVGRNAEPKQPNMALAVFNRVVMATSNARLTMVGGRDSGWKGLRKQAVKLGISDKVTCLGQRDDLNELWSNADIHLLTSITECSPLVLLEAKAQGIPTAMFELPYLDAITDGVGFVSAPQGDIEELAKRIVELVNNPNLRMKMGKDAKLALCSFTDEAVWKSWVRIFNALKTGVDGYEIDPNLKMIIMQEHFAWNRFCEKNLWAVQMARDAAKLTGGIVTMRGFARFLRVNVRCIQKLKAVFREQ